MQYIQQHGLAWYTFSEPGRDFQHALITRLGGVSCSPYTSLNLGSTVGDDPKAVAENHQRLFQALGLNPDCVVSPHQVHGRHVAHVDMNDGGTVIPKTDALISHTPGVALLLRFADCVPVLFYDPVHQAVGLAHAGWRGVAAGIVEATVHAMAEAFGTHPADLWAGIGPAIGVDHYEVGLEVIESVKGALPPAAQVSKMREGRWYLNMAEAVAMQLRAAGVQHIEQSGICTACRTGEWYSHRQENGQTGRFGVIVRLAQSSGQSFNLE